MTGQLMMKLFLAAVSGFTVSLLYKIGPSESHPVGWFLQYGMAGALFAITVLWPYLHRDATCIYRGAGLIVASVLSYWLSVRIVGEWHSSPFIFLLASAAGMSIVIVALRLLVPLPGSLSYVAPAILASIIGGIAMDAAAANDTMLSMLLGFVTWHMSAAAAIHIGRRRAVFLDVNVTPEAARLYPR